MSEDALHVVFGAGQVGRALATRLADLGHPVRTVSLHRPEGCVSGIDCHTAESPMRKPRSTPPMVHPWSISVLVSLTPSGRRSFRPCNEM